MTEQTPLPPPPRSSLVARFALVCFLVGVTIAVWGVVRGELSITALKTLLTCFGTSLYLLLFSACVTNERGFYRSVEVVGRLSALIAHALFMAILWRGALNEVTLRHFAATSLLAFACTHTALLQRALVGKTKWLVSLTQTALWFIAAQQLVFLLFDVPPPEIFARWLAVAWIAKWSGTITVGALHVLNKRGRTEGATDSSSAPAPPNAPSQDAGSAASSGDSTAAKGMEP